jgi:hypothetical protein
MEEHGEPAHIGARTKPDRRDLTSRETLLRRVRGEFYEMPCLHLTRAQAQRLFALRPDICQRILGALIAEGTIACGQDERYRLNDSRTWPVRRLGAASHDVLSPAGC